MSSATVQLILDGLVVGALYALMGLGVVIVYRATKVLNFATGAVATTSGFIAAGLAESGVPYVAALGVAVGAGLVMGAVLGLVVTRVFARVGSMETSLATLGVGYIITYLNRTAFGSLPAITPKVFAVTLEVGGIRLQGHDLYLIAVALVALLFTMWLVNRTTLGLAMRALSQDGPIARSLGVSYDLVSVSAWVISSGLAALAGVLVSSFIQVDQDIMGVVGIQSLMALVLGGFGTAAGAIAGGVTLGVGTSLVVGFLDPALKGTFVFIAVLAILAIRPQGLVGKKEIVVQESAVWANLPSLPAVLWRSIGAVDTRVVVGILILGAALLPFMPLPFPLVTLSVLLATAIVVLSLGFVIGYVGEFSLGHGALATIGAYAVAVTLHNVGEIALLPALLLAAASAAVVGALIAWATLRLTGLYLAIATLAFIGVVIELGRALTALTGGPLGMGVNVRFGDSGATTEIGIYYLAALGFLVGAVIFEVLLRSRWAIRWVAIRDVPAAARANGVAVRRQKVLAFTISSAVAGLGGGILAIAVTHIGPEDFGLTWSFVAVLAAMLGGAGSTVGALGGTAVIVFVPLVTSQSDLGELVFGFVIVLLMAVAPRGLPDFAARLGRRLRAGQSVQPQPAMGSDLRG